MFWRHCWFWWWYFSPS